eukprot:c367_g1_i2.p1 GENE.c367_g1_i2~~c367_g1_i2.p1  ORF type:complete len:161 (-),score=28.76 c367_g1_i2:42-524(-)
MHATIPNTLMQAKKAEITARLQALKQQNKDKSEELMVKRRRRVIDREEHGHAPTQTTNETTQLVSTTTAIFDHLKANDCWIDQTELEAKLQDLIRQGKFSEAEHLSDVFAQQELERNAQKVAATQRLAERLESRNPRQPSRPKPHWGFRTKRRWECKGNM